MEKKQLSARQVRERQVLPWAPLGLVPLLTLLFWTLHGKGAATQDPTAKEGFNTRLPAPILPVHKAWEKEEYYEQATRDSAAAAQKERSGDAYAAKILEDTNVKKLEEKMVGINRQLAEVPKAPTMTTEVRRVPPPQRETADNPDIERLERMMGLLKRDKEGDPEIRELGGLIEKVLQAKGGAEEREGPLPASAKMREALSLRRAPAPEAISLLGTDSVAVHARGFYGLGDGEGIGISDQGLVAAVVTDGRQVAKGSSVRMELLADIRIGSVTIPRGEFIYGVCGSPGSDRLPISVSSILYNRQSFPVALRVLGSDGQPGLPIPGSFSREAVRESAAQGMNSITPATIDPSVGAQAASAGIQVARSLAGRKVRAETARVEAGVKVFLQDLKQ